MGLSIKIRYRTAALSITGLLIMFTGSASAACSFLGSVTTHRQNINFGHIILEHDLPVGSVVWRGGMTANFDAGETDGVHKLGVMCDAQSYHNPNWSTSVGQPSFNGAYLLDIGISGLALRQPRWSPASAYPDRGPLSRGCAPDTVNKISRWCTSDWRLDQTLELVKIAPTTGSGSMNIGAELLRASFADPSVSDFTVTQIFIGAGSVTTIGCSVTTPTVPVPLRRVQSSQFNGTTRGSTSPDVRFNIGLDCSQGTKVNLQLDATPDSSAIPGTIALNQTPNVATGAGVRLMHLGKAVAFGQPWEVGTAATSGPYNIPLVAHYIRTAQDGKMTGGEANANATFTLTYQ